MNFKSTIELSIIIISYNTNKITKNCLESLYRSMQDTTIPYEIIVIDNHSTDKSAEMITKLDGYKKDLIKLYINKDNVGFAKANNQGISYAKGEYIFLLNSDTETLDNAVELLLDHYKTHEKEIQFLGGKLLNKDMTAQPSCGPFYTPPVIFGALFLKGDYWGLTRYSPNFAKAVDWISGACILTKKEFLEKLYGFDENIFMYMDEIDLLYRAKQRGYRVWFYPDARFIHLGSASSNGKTYPILQVYRGFTYFYKKHYKSGFSVYLLKTMLQLKSLVAILLGKLFHNSYLVKTYEQAFKIARMD